MEPNSEAKPVSWDRTPERIEIRPGRKSSVRISSIQKKVLEETVAKKKLEQKKAPVKKATPKKPAVKKASPRNAPVKKASPSNDPVKKATSKDKPAKKSTPRTDVTKKLTPKIDSVKKISPGNDSVKKTSLRKTSRRIDLVKNTPKSNSAKKTITRKELAKEITPQNELEKNTTVISDTPKRTTLRKSAEKKPILKNEPVKKTTLRKDLVKKETSKKRKSTSPARNSVEGTPRKKKKISQPSPEALIKKITKETKVTCANMKIGFVGVGEIGAALIKHLIDIDQHFFVWHNDKRELKDLERNKFEVVDTMGQLLKYSNIIMVCAESEKFSNEFFDYYISTGLKTTAFDKRSWHIRGKYFVDLTDMDLQNVIFMRDTIKENHGHYLEARFLGSLNDAKEGTLKIFASGDVEVFDACARCFQKFSEVTRYEGPWIGQATAWSSLLSMLKGVGMQSMSQTHGLLRRDDLPVDNVLNEYALGPLGLMPKSAEKFVHAQDQTLIRNIKDSVQLMLLSIQKYDKLLDFGHMKDLHNYIRDLRLMDDTSSPSTSYGKHNGEESF